MDFGGFDHQGAGEFVFDFGNAPFDKALALFGGFVFGVFRQIAVRARFGNRGDYFGAGNALELLQFAAQQFGAVFG